MLLTDNYQVQIKQRLQPVIQELIEENQLYQEDLDSADIVNQIMQMITKNALTEELIKLSEPEFKKRCNGFLALVSWAKSLTEISVQDWADIKDAIQGV